MLGHHTRWTVEYITQRLELIQPYEIISLRLLPA